MPPIDYAAQVASFTSESFTDGAPSDGAPTAQEAAASAANKSGEGEGAEGQEQQEELENGDGDTGSGEGAGEAGGGADGGEAAGAGETGQQPAAGEKGKGAGKKSAGERIGELTANWRSEERRANSEKERADNLARELAELKSGKATLTTQTDTGNGGEGAPDPSQFDYGEMDPKYIAALARYHTGKELAAQRAADDKKRQDDAAAATQREVAQKTDALVKAGATLHDDFDEVVMQGAREGKWELSTHLGQLLLDSEFGAQIAYDLAKNPTEAARVAKLSPAEQAKFLGRQEAKFEAAKPSQGKTPPKVPQAQTPPKTPRGSSGSNKVDASSDNFAAVEAAWRGGQFRN